MLLWRICREKHAKTAFDGEGARLNPGRWNHAGVPVVYCASSFALAYLELLVHVDFDDLPEDLVTIRAELPDSVAVDRVAMEQLPRNWRDHPGPVDLQDLGSAWASLPGGVALLVPSVLSPTDVNVLLNPRHLGMSKLSVSAPEPFDFDPRLGKR